MEVNYCHRLIKYEIEKGVNFRKGHQRIPCGVYATKDYKSGEIVRTLNGDLILQPIRESIHIGNNMHVIDEYGKYINHSFEPNTEIVINKIVAKRDIKQYEEITFDYNESEINMAEPFEIDGVKVCGKQNI